MKLQHNTTLAMILEYSDEIPIFDWNIQWSIYVVWHGWVWYYDVCDNLRWIGWVRLRLPIVIIYVKCDAGHILRDILDDMSIFSRRGPYQVDLHALS